MADLTDKPFRLLAKSMGAGLAVSEMTTSDPCLWHTRRSLAQMDYVDEPAPISALIAGYDPQMPKSATFRAVVNRAGKAARQIRLTRAHLDALQATPLSVAA